MVFALTLLMQYLYINLKHMMSQAELHEYNQQLEQRIRYAAYHLPGKKFSRLAQMMLSAVCSDYHASGEYPVDGNPIAMGKAHGTTPQLARKTLISLMVEGWLDSQVGTTMYWPTGAMRALYGEVNKTPHLEKLPEAPAMPVLPPTAKRAAKDGFVYLMLNKRNGYYKIGHSTVPKFREKTLQAEEPEIEMLTWFVGTTAKERELHELYAEKRIRGEWFALSVEDVNALMQL
ncbi:GIY-YIG nuclease family protein [Hymenobacter fodinae]|uniref:Bacteriophage T5 Orf172 DNA-binding domain-containing protein n=1 Tax=Hymenobacter fodinae TaxID=2510796 RepID=A0A4Z0P2L4_9BACT|nr:GIY-YIG nuclease family protein [Hymenobacter fodinae]TGE05594.1 hypothetical protein EU556_20040 [Hymenobacter fodinae]